MLWLVELVLILNMLYFVFFFFSSRRRHTRLQGDWSSDVCSSDLRLGIELKTEPALAHGFNVERLRRLIGKNDADCIMVVGHEPEFSEVIKELTDRKSVV